MKTCNKVIFPSLNDQCGDYFKYRDFTDCSETWLRTRIDNVPRQIETYAAMKFLVDSILDPLTKTFVRPVLTYAFSSAELISQIRMTSNPNITPSGDQHAGCELNKRGNLICKRRGLAVDLFVPGISSYVVACWVVENTPFDRLYFYSAHRPFHVSAGPEHTKSVIVMNGFKGGRHLPRSISREAFCLSVEQ